MIDGKLQTFYNGTATVYDDTVKIGTKVSVVYVGNNFYVVYTDNSDSKIKMMAIGTPYLMTTSYIEHANKTQK